ncbi:hypothetical protein ACFLTH_17085 [Bacteroidota bacterium]
MTLEEKTSLIVLTSIILLGIFSLTLDVPENTSNKAGMAIQPTVNPANMTQYLNLLTVPLQIANGYNITNEDIAYIEDVMFGDGKSVSNYFKEISNEILKAKSVVSEKINLSLNSSSKEIERMDAAIIILRETFNLSEFDRIIFISNTDDFDFTAISLGETNIYVDSMNHNKEGYLAPVIIHEILHRAPNTVIGHARALNASPATINEKIGLFDKDFDLESGEFYSGDPFTVMGRTVSGRHLNGFEKLYWNFLNDDDVTRIVLDENPINKTLNLSYNEVLVLSLRERLSNKMDLFLETRKPKGLFDNFDENSSVVNGVTVRFVDPFKTVVSPQSYLIDTTPETDERFDAPLTVGKTLALLQDHLFITVEKVITPGVIVMKLDYKGYELFQEGENCTIGKQCLSGLCVKGICKTECTPQSDFLRTGFPPDYFWLPIMSGCSDGYYEYKARGVAFAGICTLDEATENLICDKEGFSFSEDNNLKNECKDGNICYPELVSNWYKHSAEYGLCFNEECKMLPNQLSVKINNKNQTDVNYLSSYSLLIDNKFKARSECFLRLDGSSLYVLGHGYLKKDEQYPIEIGIPVILQAKQTGKIFHYINCTWDMKVGGFPSIAERKVVKVNSRPVINQR